jgi:hypothetical protein
MQFTFPYMVRISTNAPFCTSVIADTHLKINPDAGDLLGGKVGFIFLGTGLIAAIGGWYLYPETKVSSSLVLRKPLVEI